MVEQARSWLKENSTLALFLVGQLIALGAAASAILAYAVRLEIRVHTMETRGAEYTVDRMNKMFDRLTVLEKRTEEDKTRIDRIVDQLLKDMQQKRPP